MMRRLFTLPLFAAALAAGSCTRTPYALLPRPAAPVAVVPAATPSLPAPAPDEAATAAPSAVPAARPVPAPRPSRRPLRLALATARRVATAPRLRHALRRPAATAAVAEVSRPTGVGAAIGGVLLSLLGVILTLGALFSGSLPVVIVGLLLLVGGIVVAVRGLS